MTSAATVDGAIVVSAVAEKESVVTASVVKVVTSAALPALVVVVVSTGSEVKSTVEVGSSVVVDESSTLTVTFASCSMLDRSKP